MDGQVNGRKAKSHAAEVAARLCAAGKRAAKEADERRKTVPREPPALAELGGQTGPEPTRFGDWEKKGLISDF